MRVICRNDGINAAICIGGSDNSDRPLFPLLAIASSAQDRANRVSIMGGVGSRRTGAVQVAKEFNCTGNDFDWVLMSALQSQKGRQIYSGAAAAGKAAQLACRPAPRGIASSTTGWRRPL